MGAEEHISRKGTEGVEKANINQPEHNENAIREAAAAAYKPNEAPVQRAVDQVKVGDQQAYDPAAAFKASMERLNAKWAEHSVVNHEGTSHIDRALNDPVAREGMKAIMAVFAELGDGSKDPKQIAAVLEKFQKQTSSNA